MKKFEVIVWYRFTRNGEQEKEWENFIIEAHDGQSAVVKALENFTSLSAIPFSTEVKEL